MFVLHSSSVSARYVIKCSVIFFYSPFENKNHTFLLSTDVRFAVESLGGGLEHDHQSRAPGDMAGVPGEY